MKKRVAYLLVTVFSLTALPASADRASFPAEATVFVRVVGRVRVVHHGRLSQVLSEPDSVLAASPHEDFTVSFGLSWWESPVLEAREAAAGLFPESRAVWRHVLSLQHNLARCYVCRRRSVPSCGRRVVADRGRHPRRQASLFVSRIQGLGPPDSPRLKSRWRGENAVVSCCLSVPIQGSTIKMGSSVQFSSVSGSLTETEYLTGWGRLSL